MFINLGIVFMDLEGNVYGFGGRCDESGGRCDDGRRLAMSSVS